MDRETKKYLSESMGIDLNIIETADLVEEEIQEVFKSIDCVKEYNQIKVINAMQQNKLSTSHFAGTTGYGYDDIGRDVLDCVYANVFKAEDALVRHQIAAGTHALALCMFGNMRPGDEILSITGKPYDTLEEVIGLRGEGGGSLKEWGVSYRQVDLLDNGRIDFQGVSRAINSKTKLVYIQRSRGYGWRPSLRINEIKQVCQFIKKCRQDLIILVDNCYGEFVEKMEPIEAGADIVAGSLIKNPGGGLAPTGGYIAGRKCLVRNAANRLTAPGLGKKVGASLGHNRLLFQGLFMSPHVVAENLKGAVFCAALMEKLGFETSPGKMDKRGDTIQAIKFNNSDGLIAFCQGIQKGSPVDSFVTPVPWSMPGYDCCVIMAAGGFIQGSTSELSCDAPIKPPYIAYMQGGLIYEHIKLGIMVAVRELMEAL